MDGPDAPFETLYKTQRISPLGSRSNGPDVIRHRYIRAVITCVMIAGGPRAHFIDARRSIARRDPTLSIAPCHLHQKKGVD